MTDRAGFLRESRKEAHEPDRDPVHLDAGVPVERPEEDRVRVPVEPVRFGAGGNDPRVVGILEKDVVDRQRQPAVGVLIEQLTALILAGAKRALMHGGIPPGCAGTCLVCR